MAKCQLCHEFYPPGFTKPIPGTKYHKCKFCEQGKDKILETSTITGDLQWDIKSEIINKYKQYLNELIKNKEKRQVLYRGINETN